MLLTAIKISLMCMSFLTWMTTGIGGYFLLRYNKRRTFRNFPVISILFFILWLASTVNLYKHLYLCPDVTNLPAGIAELVYNVAVISCSGYIIGKLTLYQGIKWIFLCWGKEDFPIRLSPPRKRRKIILTEEQKIQIHNRLHSSDSIQSKVTLKEMAKEVLIDRDVLSRYIKQEYGGNLSEVITSIRLQRAEEILTDESRTGLTMIEVSEEVGFQSPSTFFEAFYKRHKMSPLMWKKRQQSGTGPHNTP